MAMPDKLGGSDDDKGKPGLVIAFGMKRKPRMPEKLGGSENEEPEGDDEHISNEQAMDDATDEIVSALDDMNRDRKRKRLKSALKAFFYACDAEPHDEGEHTEDEGSED